MSRSSAIKMQKTFLFTWLRKKNLWHKGASNCPVEQGWGKGERCVCRGRGENLIGGLKKANVQFVFFLCRLNALTAACTA